LVPASQPIPSLTLRASRACPLSPVLLSRPFAQFAGRFSAPLREPPLLFAEIDRAFRRAEHNLSRRHRT
jgi:hypothetical protein